MREAVTVTVWSIAAGLITGALFAGFVSPAECIGRAVAMAALFAVYLAFGGGQ